MSSKALLEDPRNPSLETKEVLPYQWRGESMADSLNTSGMFLSGLIMVTRNRYLAWPSVAFGISGLVNSHPLRAKEGSAGGWSSLLLCVSALIASYVPLFVITNPVAT